MRPGQCRSCNSTLSRRFAFFVPLGRRGSSGRRRTGCLRSLLAAWPRLPRCARRRAPSGRCHEPRPFGARYRAGARSAARRLQASDCPSRRPRALRRSRPQGWSRECAPKKLPIPPHSPRRSPQTAMPPQLRRRRVALHTTHPATVPLLALCLVLAPPFARRTLPPHPYRTPSLFSFWTLSARRPASRAAHRGGQVRRPRGAEPWSRQERKGEGSGGSEGREDKGGVGGENPEDRPGAPGGGTWVLGGLCAGRGGPGGRTGVGRTGRGTHPGNPCPAACPPPTPPVPPCAFH